MYEHSDCILCSIGGAGGVTTDGEAVVGTAGGDLVLPKALEGGGVNTGGTAGVLTGMLNAAGNEGAANAGGKGGGAAIAGALALLPKRPGGVFGREDKSVSTSCFTGGTHEPNCGLGEAGCGTIAGGADLDTGGTKVGASVSPVRGALARGELLTGRVPVVLGVKANGEVAGGFGRD